MTDRRDIRDFLAGLTDAELAQVLAEARDTTDEKASKSAHEETSYPASWRTQ